MKPTFNDILWKLYRRSDKPRPNDAQIDRLWRDPTFSERVLTEHLDDTHGAASRSGSEQETQLDWLWHHLKLTPQGHLFDVTCGPGLYATKFAHKGCSVTGIDFNPVAIAYARDLARLEGVSEHCTFVEQDVRQLSAFQNQFEAAILLYAQLEGFDRQDGLHVLQQIAQSLKPSGRLCLEMLNQDRVDQADSSWWYTDNQGVWADEPYLHMGERFWYAEEGLAIERYHIIHLESGHVEEAYICNQTYSVEAMTALLKEAGFQSVQVHPAWGDLPLYDAEEWMVYIAEK